MDFFIKSTWWSQYRNSKTLKFVKMSKFQSSYDARVSFDVILCNYNGNFIRFDSRSVVEGEFHQSTLCTEKGENTRKSPLRRLDYFAVYGFFDQDNHTPLKNEAPGAHYQTTE